MHLLNRIRKAIRLDGRNQEAKATLPVNASAHQECEEEIPRYPPFMQGLPATHPDKLINTQRELIDQIREAGLASSDIFEQFYVDSLRRFASYAHLLPASQTHHHRGAGGLLRHAAEVALWSLQSGDRVLLPGEQAPRRRRELEPRWHLAVFLAALCHDAGKPITDLTVTSRDGANVWNPFVEDLYSWAERHGVDRYFLHWRENRGKKHTAVSPLMLERIVSQKGLAWISEGDNDLVIWMMETINGHPSAENLIHDLVIRADQASVEKDLRSLGVAFTGYEIGLPVERFLVDIMRRLVHEGTWGINEPGSRLWHIDGHLYLVWPVAGEEIAAVINQEKIPGLPRTPGSILDMLVDRKLASIREDVVEGERLWVIAPAVLAAKIPNIRLTAIRLRDTVLVTDIEPPAIAGKILDLREPVKEPTDIQPPEAPAKVEAQALPENSPVPDQPEKTDASQPATADEQLDGSVGGILKAFADDILAGKKSYEDLIHVDASGALCLKWPDALNGYGLASKAILDELSCRNWLALDPLSPFRKVIEVEMECGKKWKAIRLQPAVKKLMAIENAPKEQTGSPPAAPCVQQLKPVSKGKVEGAREDTRLELIQNIVTTLRDGVREGILKPEQEGSFVWIPSRKAEPFLVERLKIRRMMIMSVGDVVPDVFLCQTRKKLHCYRIPAMPSTGQAT